MCCADSAHIKKTFIFFTLKEGAKSHIISLKFLSHVSYTFCFAIIIKE